MNIKSSEWPEVIRSFVAGCTVEIEKHVTETENRISPRARERNDYARGTKSTWSLVFWFEGHNLAEEYEHDVETPVFTKKSDAESYDWRKFLAECLDGTYWDYVDHCGEGGIADRLAFTWLTNIL